MCEFICLIGSGWAIMSGGLEALRLGAIEAFPVWKAEADVAE